MNRFYKKICSQSVTGVIVSAFMMSSMPSYAQVPELHPVPMHGTGSTTLPNIGGVNEGLTWAEERELGDLIAGFLQQDVVYEKDPLLHAYVVGIWERLLDAAAQSGELSADLKQRMAWELFLIRDPTVNAFALPGAYVGVNLGLISVVESQDELASVLAHESVHIFQRHIARSYGLSKDLSALSLATLVLGVLALGIDPNLGGAVIMGGGAASVQGQINFTRSMEYEADRIGYKVLTRAGFEPQGMADMFKRLSEASRFSDTTNFPYLRTHPLTDVRIAEAQMRLGEGMQLPKTVTQDWVQEQMSARASVIGNSKPDSLRSSQIAAYDASKKQVRSTASVKALYAGALSALKQRQFSIADQIYAELLIRVSADEKAYQVASLLGVEIALTEGSAPKAQARLAQLELHKAPSLQRVGLLMQAQTMMLSHDAVTASKLLESWVHTHPKDEYAWSLLGAAYRANEQHVLALRAEAEVRMIVGDFEGAIDRFKVALNRDRLDSTTMYDLELIQSRLRVAQERQLAKQKMLK